MTFPDERDSGLEELLRTTLRGEADPINPSGDGLARIQQRVNARRSRRMWLRPVAAVGALAVVGGAGFAAYAFTRPTQDNDTISASSAHPSSPATSTPTPTATPSVPVQASAFPATGMFPYTSGAAEQAGGLSWAGNSEQVAEHFVSDLAGVAGVDQVVTSKATKDQASVTLGRFATGNRMVPVTTVQLVHYGNSWIVVGATDARGTLVVTTPTAGANATSPILVSGPDYGADESVQLSLRSVQSVGPLATGNVSFGSDGQSWSAKLRFTPPADPVGGVVAYETSAEDGGPARLAVIPVRFGSSSVQAAGYPPYFYGIKSDRVTKFASRNGAAVDFLTAAQPGGGASDPQLVGDRVYYLAGAGTCANALMSVATSGGASDTIAMPNAGYVITSYGISADGTKVALFETACQPTGAQPQGLLVSSVRGTSTTHTVQFPSFPPMILGNPAWESDGQHLDAVLRTGNAAGPVRYDAFAAKDAADTANPPSCSAPTSGMPQDLQVDAAGNVWLAEQDGDAMSVVRCTGSKLSTVFTVAGQDTPSELAVTSDGQAVLLTDINGAVWRWTTGSASPTKLSPSVPLTAVSW